MTIDPTSTSYSTGTAPGADLHRRISGCSKVGNNLGSYTRNGFNDALAERTVGENANNPRGAVAATSVNVATTSYAIFPEYELTVPACLPMHAIDGGNRCGDGFVPGGGGGT